MVTCSATCASGLMDAAMQPYTHAPVHSAHRVGGTLFDRQGPVVFQWPLTGPCSGFGAGICVRTAIKQVLRLTKGGGGATMPRNAMQCRPSSPACPPASVHVHAFSSCHTARARGRRCRQVGPWMVASTGPGHIAVGFGWGEGRGSPNIPCSASGF